MLRQRLLSASVAIPIIFLAIWFGDPWFSLLVATAALLGVVEFYRMVSSNRWDPLTFLGAVWTLLFVINAHFDSLGTTAMIVTSAVMLSLVCTLLVGSRGDQVFHRWAWSLAGMLYMGWMLSYWILLMNSDDWAGRDWVLVAILSTFAVDTSAYFVGRAWGRHKMAPTISPGKTWEGALGGLVGAIAAVVILAVILHVEMGYGELVFIGLMVGVFAQIGDLAESKLKRSTGVKEAGSLIPGHGGILDRLDSVVFTGVVVYYCLGWLAG